MKEIRAVGFIPTAYRIVDADTPESIVIGPVTSGITNTATLRYKATADMPDSAGAYEIQWDDGTDTWDATEDLTVEGPDPENETVALNAISKFPVGTVVSVYRAFQASPSGGSPSGSPAATATVASDGSLSLVGLTDGGSYIAAAQVNGAWQTLQLTG